MSSLNSLPFNVKIRTKRQREIYSFPPHLLVGDQALNQFSSLSRDLLTPFLTYFSQNIQNPVKYHCSPFSPSEKFVIWFHVFFTCCLLIFCWVVCFCSSAEMKRTRDDVYAASGSEFKRTFCTSRGDSYVYLFLYAFFCVLILIIFLEFLVHLYVVLCAGKI